MCLDANDPPPPRSVDPRLVLEQVAKEPEIVTPTGLAVDPRGRVLVIESHTHFRPKGYRGPTADRIRVFEDTNGDGRLEATGTFFEGTKLTMSLAFARDGRLFVATRSAIYRMEDRDGDGRADGEAARAVPAPLVRLDTPGDYPHNGLSGFAFDLAGNVYFGLGETWRELRLIGSDGTVLAAAAKGETSTNASPMARSWNGSARVSGTRFTSPSTPSAGCSPSTTTPTRDRLAACCTSSKGAITAIGSATAARACTHSRPGTASCRAPLPMVAGTGEAPSGVLVYESDNLPEEYRGSLLVTSWGDHRIERYRLQPRGASFRAAMEPIVIGDEDFRPVGIAVAPDGSIYFSDWVDKSYELHGKGRIWRLRNRATVPRQVSSKPEENLAHRDRRVRRASCPAPLVSQGDERPCRPGQRGRIEPRPKSSAPWPSRF